MPLNEEQRKRIEEEARETFPSRMRNGMGREGMFTYVDDCPREREGYVAGRIKNHSLHEESLRLLKEAHAIMLRDHPEEATETSIYHWDLNKHIDDLSSLVGGAYNEQR